MEKLSLIAMYVTKRSCKYVMYVMKLSLIVKSFEKEAI